MIIFWNELSLVDHSPGMGYVWGPFESNIFLNFLWFSIKYLSNDLNTGSCDIAHRFLYSYFHYISPSQSNGLSRESVSPLGPAKKNLHYYMLILSSPNNIFVVKRNEKSSLWTSNKERQTFWYRLYVNVLFTLRIRCSTTLDGAELSIAAEKSLANHCNEY